MEAAIQVQEMKREISLSDLTAEEKKKVYEIKDSIDIDDSQGIIQYGTRAQSNISNFADSILQQVKAREAGTVGETLTDLMLTVKKLDVESLSGESFMSKIPILGSLVDSSRKFIAQYQSIEHHIEEIIDEMNKARMQLLKDVTLLDALYDKSRDYLKELELYIIAGELKLNELNETILPAIRAEAAVSGDALDAQKVQDLTQMINRFEKKIYDLKLSRIVSIQSLPQVRLIQNNDQILVEKIQSSILNTIPLWKNQVVIAISLFRQKKALELQKDVTRTTNDLLQKNADMLKTGSIEVAKESEKGIVEIDTLKKVHENLISTIEETLKIQAEGKTRRMQAEVEITKLENDLKARLAQVKSPDADLKL